MRRFLPSISLVFIFCFGCTAPTQVMVRPDTWEQADCSTWGVGLMGAASAYSAYDACVKKYYKLGYVPSEKAEAMEPPRFEAEADTPASPCIQPVWVPNSKWEYRVTGGTTDEKYRSAVRRTDTFRGKPAYLHLNPEGKSIVFSEELEYCAVSNVGNIEVEYSPPFRTFNWPLAVGKSWTSNSVATTSTDSMKVTTYYEIKGYGKVRVPAGVFDAFYILGKDNKRKFRLEELWYSPKVRMYVKAVQYYRGGNNYKGGKITEELTYYCLGGVDCPPRKYSIADNPIKKEAKKLASIQKEVIKPRVYLRSESMEMSEGHMRRMLMAYGFFDYSQNPQGSFDNDFVDNGDGTVTDRSTGLMWQKIGSSRAKSKDAVGKYIMELIYERFAGYWDWRLPTADELASLLEMPKVNGVHINPVFDKRQKRCWSSDSKWLVDFADGKITEVIWGSASDSISERNYVRAVRSIK